MSYEMVANGQLVDIPRMKDYEFAFEEGQRGLIQLNLRTSVPSSVAKELENQLKQKGVAEARVTTGSPRLNIYFRKGFPWLAVIAATILALAVLAVLILSWSIFRQVVPESLQSSISIAGILVILLVIAAMGLKEFKS